MDAGDICPDCETVGIPGALCPKHAAADDLLAALKLALQCIGSNDMLYSQGDHGERVYVRDEVVKAVSKAEGR
jgi:hypothetical protein